MDGNNKNVPKFGTSEEENMGVCTKTIICHNIKGGVRKSTTAVNLSYILSTMGYKVLGIDLDPQKNFTPFFRQADENKTIYHLLASV